MNRIAIIGAKGAVGQEILSLLQKKKFPISSLTLFGRKEDYLSYGEDVFPIVPLAPENIDSYDLAFFCAGATVSKNFVPEFRKKTDLIIDLSSHFRMERDVPLIVPEVNIQEAYNHSGLIASPNCIAIIASVALNPFHRQYELKRAVITTYQAASGAGYKAMEALIQETNDYLLHKKRASSFFPVPYAFNLFLHNSPLDSFGFNGEERKVQEEIQKILSIPNCSISPTCVRVPTLRAHSISINAEFINDIQSNNIMDFIENAPGIRYCKDITPQTANGQEDVFCGRLRRDPSINGIDMWIIGDQLLKGAALNAYQIAEHVTSKSRLGAKPCSLQKN